MLAVCCLGMAIGCGTNPSKNENVKETLPALVVNGTQLMNTEGDTVVLHGVSYGWHQFWPRFYNAFFYLSIYFIKIILYKINTNGIILTRNDS